MSADRTREERALAAIVHGIRDEWDVAGVVVILRRCSERPLAQVSAAAIYCAHYRTDQRTPECIARPGEHWSALDRMAGRTGTDRGPDPKCPKHDEFVPCLTCQREARGPIASPERIREIREQARAVKVDS